MAAIRNLRIEKGYYYSAKLARRTVWELSVSSRNVEASTRQIVGKDMFKWLRSVAIERELTEILDRHQQVRRDASDIRDYLLWVLEQDRNGGEKFSDEALNRAAEIYEQVGAGALYWMTDIAAQMVVLAEATLRGFPTNISIELGTTATSEEIVQSVVKLP
jgi:hypothetical protein